jgi:predicted RNase H-like nuclease (RuvC/YqgF family)
MAAPSGEPYPEQRSSSHSAQLDQLTKENQELKDELAEKDCVIRNLELQLSTVSSRLLNRG